MTEDKQSGTTEAKEVVRQSVDMTKTHLRACKTPTETETDKPVPVDLTAAELQWLLDRCFTAAANDWDEVDSKLRIVRVDSPHVGLEYIFYPVELRGRAHDAESFQKTWFSKKYHGMAKWVNNVIRVSWFVLDKSRAVLCADAMME